MFEALCRHPTICQFFMAYPKTQWVRCLEAVVLLGISSAHSKLCHGAPIDQLEFEAKKSSLRLPSRREDPPSTSVSPSRDPQSYVRTGSAPHQRARHRPLIMYPNLAMQHLEGKAKPVLLDEDTPRFNLNETPKSGRQLSPGYHPSPKPMNRSSPAIKAAEKMNSSRGDTPRKLPKYLENVESKIRPQIKRDICEFKAQFEETKTKKRINLRKSSSFGDLAQWSESLIGGNREEKENEMLTEPNVSMCGISKGGYDCGMMLSEPNTSLRYAGQLKPHMDSSLKSPSIRGTAKFTSKHCQEQNILSLTDQFLSSPMMQLSNRSYHLNDFISTTPMSIPDTKFPEAERTAPTSINSRYDSLCKEYETRRNDFVRRLSSISSISSVIPEEEPQRKSPTPTLSIKTESYKATPSSRTSSFPWMDSYSPNTSFYDREDIRNPMYQDALLNKFL